MLICLTYEKLRKSSVFLHKRQEFLDSWPTPLIPVVGEQKGRWIFMSSRVPELHYKTLSQNRHAQKITYSKNDSSRTRVG